MIERTGLRESPKWSPGFIKADTGKVASLSASPVCLPDFVVRILFCSVNKFVADVKDGVCAVKIGGVVCHTPLHLRVSGPLRVQMVFIPSIYA